MSIKCLPLGRANRAGGAQLPMHDDDDIPIFYSILKVSEIFKASRDSVHIFLARKMDPLLTLASPGLLRINLYLLKRLLDTLSDLRKWTGASNVPILQHSDLGKP